MAASGSGEHETYDVVSPLGEPVMKTIPMAPRLDTLEGKTIGHIWNGGFRGDESFPMIDRLLREHYPTVKMVPYTEFPVVSIASLHPEKKQETLAALRAKLKETGCDAVITGNGC